MERRGGKEEGRGGGGEIRRGGRKEVSPREGPRD